jgi:hypothetical protein
VPGPDLAQIAAEICPGDPLDLGIAWAVKVLRDGGVETYESCEGGQGHAYPYPCVRFYGTDAAGWHALSIAITYRLPIRNLARIWTIERDKPDGPIWELRLSRPSPHSAHTCANCSYRSADSAAESAARSGSPHTCDARQDRSGLSSDMAARTVSPCSPPLDESPESSTPVASWVKSATLEVG